MKKTLLLIIAAVTASVSASSVSWSATSGTGTPSSRIYGLTDGAYLTKGADSETASITIYFMEYNDALFTSLTGEGFLTKSAFNSSYSDKVIATQTGNANAGSADPGPAGLVTKSTTSDPSFVGNVSFFGRLYATIGGTEYMMNVFGGEGVGGVWSYNAVDDIKDSKAFAWVKQTYGGSVTDVASAKNVWIKAAVVPEPATAALALLGIGMLIRRRRRA